jgi:hypothetical protein
VANGGHRGRTATAVKVTVALVVVEINPLPAHNRGIRAVQIALDDTRAFRVHQLPHSEIVDEERHDLAWPLDADRKHSLDIGCSARSRH